MSIDLHCHTLFSIDSYGTPEALVDAAADTGVTAVAITDHNHIGGVARGAAHARRRGILFFPGVELDAYYGERSFHFLGLGFTPQAAPKLGNLIEQNQKVYASRFEKYYDILLQHGFPWSKAQLATQLPIRYPTHPAPLLTHRVVPQFVGQQGGWKNFDEIHEMARRRLMDDGDRPRIDARFCEFTEARDAIHEAGGVILLAHAGKAFPNDPEAQIGFIRQLMREGLDGFELYHYANYKSSQSFARLLDFVRETDCLVSGGSDCGHHKNPAATHVGKSALGEPLAPDTVAERLAAACGKIKPGDG